MSGLCPGLIGAVSCRSCFFVRSRAATGLGCLVFGASCRQLHVTEQHNLLLMRHRHVLFLCADAFVVLCVCNFCRGPAGVVACSSAHRAEVAAAAPGRNVGWSSRFVWSAVVPLPTAAGRRGIRCLGHVLCSVFWFVWQLVFAHGRGLCLLCTIWLHCYCKLASLRVECLVHALPGVLAGACLFLCVHC